MKLQDFDYYLPPPLIAQQPVDPRDQSRLLVLDRRTRSVEHRHFCDLDEYLQPGDILVINDTKVWAARLIGKKESGGKMEILLVRKKGAVNPTARVDGRTEEMASDWECLVQCSGKVRGQTMVYFEEGLRGELLERNSNGLWSLRLSGGGDMDRAVRRIGFPPLPPYVRRNGDRAMRARDLERYQTVYARREGAIAAPTAGLHFTGSLLEQIQRKGVSIHPLTLHVGIGTFQPIKHEEIEKHRLAPEIFEVYPETAKAVNNARIWGKRVIAVGTTVTRALESCADEQGWLRPERGETGLFILPGHRFRAVNSLVTNFHLPRSTLLMLVSAFAGREFILAVYQEAIKENYRFYSYGDAMLIL